MYCPFKHYQKLFGNVGDRKRFLNIPILDNVVTIISCIFISYIFSIPFPLVIIFMYILGIIIHSLFCVRTDSINYLSRFNFF